jgi:hypothetical protein
MDSWFSECRKTPGEREELETVRDNSPVRTHDEKEAFVLANKLGRAIGDIYLSVHVHLVGSWPTAASLVSLP